MNVRLFPSVKQMTAFFSITIVCVTVLVFTLRLTLFNNVMNDPVVPAAISPATIDLEGESFEYRMNATVEFASPSAEGKFQIENPESNTQYMRVEIVRNDTGKSIYYSGYIAPGESKETLTLQGETLKSGTYACKAIITAYDPDTKKATGSEEQQVTIVIGDKTAS